MRVYKKGADPELNQFNYWKKEIVIYLSYYIF
jgi:hypothetical protein